MIYTNTELYQWLRIYTQKNVYSIISANCLLDLMSLYKSFIHQELVVHTHTKKTHKKQT